MAVMAEAEKKVARVPATIVPGVKPSHCYSRDALAPVSQRAPMLDKFRR
jgi:hypothetical protein